MKRTAVVLLAILIHLSLGSCLDGKRKDSNSGQNTKDFVQVNVDNEYKIGVPRDMQQTTGLNPDASLQYQNIHDEIYTIVIDEPKKEFIAAMDELGYEEKSSVALYRDIQLSRLAERMDITCQSKPVKTTISGLQAESVEMDGKVDNIEEELSYFLTFLEGENKIYMIMSWTLKSKKQEHKKTFETIANSFALSE